jgi:cell division protein FtsI/penicillin-binding protein 2
MHPQIIQKQMPKEKWPIPLPPSIRQILIESMRRVVVKTQAESMLRLSRIYRDYPEAISDYLDLKEDLIGKTSTAEMMETVSLDGGHGTNLYKHVWFGGISFEDSAKEKPELVVVIYLRFGTYGKEAAPLAAQIVKKWREIKG